MVFPEKGREGRRTRHLFDGLLKRGMFLKTCRCLRGMSLRIWSSSQPMTGHTDFVCGDEGLEAIGGTSGYLPFFG